MGFDIFTRKGNTTHGIAASVFRIIQAITIDEKSVLPVGTLIQGQYGLNDIVLSLPTVVDKNGAAEVLIHPFEESEQKQLEDIAHSLQELIHNVAEKTGLAR